jgi:predicted nucleic acid-binding protein
VSLVLDSSAALAWCFEDEHTPATLAILNQVAEEGAIAPAIWPLEVLNGLAMAERRGRLDSVRRHQLAGFIRDLPVNLDQETAQQAWTATMRLSERHRLTLYDAAYLELAQRLELPLATLDQELRGAATVLGISLLGCDHE